MKITSPDFPANARRALADGELQRALGNVPEGFQKKRARARDALPEFDRLSDLAVEIKNHTLDYLDLYLEAFESRVHEAGGQVHWCSDAAAARETIIALCRAAGARSVAKGKSMVTEEIALNDALEAAGIRPVETDLGEYIIQLRHEPPSHIIAPAIHLNKEHVADTFRANHTALDAARDLEAPESLLSEARQILREEFLAADVGITGANFLIAETGTATIVTNEGNGDLSQTLPPVQIVVASIEKIVPTLEDAMTLTRLLARSATGQEMSVYTSFTTGPRRADDLDGPREFHVVLLDNGRSDLLAGPMRDMLRCIKCAACMNHCPVYASVGGHAYGWVYPGPMGAVLTPQFIGIEAGAHLPHASSFCGRCEAVCPVQIPLPRLMRFWRDRDFARAGPVRRDKLALRFWRLAARRPRLYRLGENLARRALRLAARAGGRAVPFFGGWTSVRDLPPPEKASLAALLAARNQKRKSSV